MTARGMVPPTPRVAPYHDRVRIVVVDDSVDIADMLAVALRLEGLDVESVSNGFGKLRNVSRWDGVDAAIVDLNMPGEVDGNALIDWMARHVPHVRRVVYTAWPREQADPVAGLADAFVQKPGSSKEILRALGVTRPASLEPAKIGPLHVHQLESAGLVWLAFCYMLAVIVSVVPDATGTRWTSATANLAIFAGYLFLAFFIAPFVRARLAVTKVAGAVFFLTCGFTHIENFLHAVDNSRPHWEAASHALIHTVQAVSVGAFAISLWVEFIARDGWWPPKLDFSRMFNRGAPRS